MENSGDFIALALPFDSDHPEFVRGFEAGNIYALCRDTDEALPNVPVRVTNAEMLLRIAHATGREVHTDELHEERGGTTHMIAHFSARRTS